MCRYSQRHKDSDGHSDPPLVDVGYSCVDHCDKDYAACVSAASGRKRCEGEARIGTHCTQTALGLCKRLATLAARTVLKNRMPQSDIHFLAHIGLGILPPGGT